jgi:hypothetical protein
MPFIGSKRLVVAIAINITLFITNKLFVFSRFHTSKPRQYGAPVLNLFTINYNILHSRQKTDY